MSAGATVLAKKASNEVLLRMTSMSCALPRLSGWHRVIDTAPKFDSTCF